MSISLSLSFEHVFRLSDDTGLLEHARGALPRRECGYCLDDVSRGLLAFSREPDLSAAQVALVSRYLTFVAHAQDTNGACRNRFGYDRRWQDEPATGDWWGRALWALGSAVSGCGPAWQRAEALDLFSLSCQRRSSWLRARAFATLGAAEVLAVIPDHLDARRLMEDSISALGRPGPDELWPWPEERLSYANAALAEALLAAGWALDDDQAIDDGLQLLDWLVDLQTADDHLSVVPAGGWSPGESQPGFDQQPIEVAALADACARAFAISGDNRWQIVVGRCVRWFLGANDGGVPMHDPETGGGYDGLTRHGPNLNQGAESTLAWLLTMQHGRRLASGPLAVIGSP
jgi:hypothetical protein